MTLGALSLAELLRLEARAQTTGRVTGKSVIFVYLPGGPSHIDLYDMKPDAPVEIRGEFRPIRTNVPGMDICELMPLQTRIADKLAVVRGYKTFGGHDGQPQTTGFRPGAYRPAFGSVVSRLRPNQGQGLPPYVTLIRESNLPFGQEGAYLGPAHRPLALRGPGMADLSLSADVSRARLHDRRQLMSGFDAIRRDMDTRGELAGMDAFTARALEMIASPRTREAFDLSREPQRVRDKFGPSPVTQQFLLARRLVEAGVRVVTLCGGWSNNGRGDPTNIGNWDTHADNFNRLREQAPHLDFAVYALINDLAERGLLDDVLVVLGGEMGRAPRVGGAPDGGGDANGRDHWETGFVLLAGGGLRTGQVVGETDRRGDRSRGNPYTPQNLLATMYHVLGIDPATTFADHNGRPQYLLDNHAPIAELI